MSLHNRVIPRCEPNRLQRFLCEAQHLNSGISDRQHCEDVLEHLRKSSVKETPEIQAKKDKSFSQTLRRKAGQNSTDGEFDPGSG